MTSCEEIPSLGSQAIPYESCGVRLGDGRRCHLFREQQR